MSSNNVKGILLGLLFSPLFMKAQERMKIIPQPVSVQYTEGRFFLSTSTAVKYDVKKPGLKAAAELLNEYVSGIAGFRLPVNVSRPDFIELDLVKMDNIGKEGYRMDITPQRIRLRANSVAGIIYGIQSLLQTLPSTPQTAGWGISCMQVLDYPRFAYRGMHLDVGRHFYPLSFVKKYIDIMATYKLNFFHWHLTEDQGWRIEIKKYPYLVTKAAYRNGTIVGSFPGTQNTNLRYGGFYTQEEVKEVVKYAAQRNITVIPEIELPGHSSAAIAAYPWLSCFPEQPTRMNGPISARSKLMQDQGATKMLQETWGVFEDIYCAGKDSTFMFLEDVLEEVLAIFPSTYIHVGGDEAPKAHWKKCSFCQTRIRKEGLKDEHGLQSYFIQRIEKFLNGKGRTLIGWDEILEGGLAPNAIVMSWRGEAGGIEAAKQAHQVIMTPGNPVYFDQYQADPSTEPLAIGGFSTLKKVYDYEPIPAELNEQQRKYVLGAQANLWTEYISTTQQVEYMVLPRMLALSEVVWSPKEKKNWEDFNGRVKAHMDAFEWKGWNYSRGNFKADIKPFTQAGQLYAAVSTEAYGGIVIYTTDGSIPDRSSKKYQEPVRINSTQTLKAVVQVDGKIMSALPAQQKFVMHKAIGREVQYTHQVSQYYLADGPHSLTDGIRGTTAVGKFWHGFNGRDLIATIDLGASTRMERISMGCLQQYNDWIFLPQSVQFEISDNAVDFKTVKIVNNPLDINEKTAIRDFMAEFPAVTGRYIRISAKNNVCPPGHSGAGHPGWIFADEIIVE